MKILIVQPSSGNLARTITLAREKLQTLSENISVELWDNTKREITYADVVKAEADLFVTFNLQGFEQSTLTDGIAYNLLNCRQIHILLDTQVSNEQFLSKQLSIAMFFYCVDTAYCEYLGKQYPDIPYLKEIHGWRCVEAEVRDTEENAGILCNIIREVAEICHIR